MTALTEIGKQVEGVWLPAVETHLVEWMTISKGAYRKNGKITYQWSKQSAAMEFADTYKPGWRKGAFVDVGAHVGLWSMWWGKECAGIVAYEPVEDFRTLYEENVGGNGVTVPRIMAPYALSDKPGSVDLRFDTHNTGSTRAYAPGEARDAGVITCEVKTIDHTLPDALADLGLPMTILKMDCEGYEENVVRGALTCIRKYKPLIVVEQKQGAKHYGFNQRGAVDLLKSEGYSVVKEISGDHIMVVR